MQVDELVGRYPVLSHVAEAGSWAQIRRHGLLTTEQLLRRFEINSGATIFPNAARRGASTFQPVGAYGRRRVKEVAVTDGVPDAPRSWSAWPRWGPDAA